MTARCPRILVVGQSFDSATGGGITLTNLFRGWPLDSLAVAAPISFPPDWTVCNNYYQLGARELRLMQPLRLAWPIRRYSGPLFPPKLKENSPSDSSAKSPYRKSGLIQSLRGFTAYAGLSEIIRHTHLTPELLAWVQSFQPDLIYTQAASINVMRLTRLLSEVSNAPYVVHMMDDWPTTLYRDRLFGPYLRWCVRREFTRLLDNATSLMGISEKMGKVYEERYRRRFQAFHNPIELDRWLEVGKRNWVANTPFRIVYAGRIGRANQQGVQDASDAVASLHAEGWSVELDLYLLEHSQESSQRFQRPGCVFVKPPIPYPQMPSILADADGLLLPLDFDPSSISFAQYSMPTKTSEYMASGTPVVVYAPADNAVTEYAGSQKWGYVVANQGVSSLKAALIRLMQDQSLREKLGQRAQSLAVDNHDAVKVREAFRQSLAAATARSLS